MQTTLCYKLKMVSTLKYLYLFLNICSMKKHTTIIKEDCLEDALFISQQIPEFEAIYPISEFDNRLKNVKHLILTAYLKEKPVGFKIGYETESKQNYYSWIGGVLPKYRKFGIAQKLLVYQEQWVKKHGYLRIIVKTRIKHKAMIQLLGKHGYIKIGTIPLHPELETRILYEKKL